MSKVNTFLTISGWRGGNGRVMGARMASPKNPRSLGILFAILPLGGAIGAGFMGQPVIGLLAGFALALVLTTLFWLADRRR